MDTPSFRSIFQSPIRAHQESNQAKAEGGDADSQFSLGLRFATSPGASQDYLHAAHWYGKAADQNHAGAQFNLGVMYAAGQGVAQDESQAVGWFERAARLGDAGAQHHLGIRQRHASHHVKPEEAIEFKVEAYKWFRLAAAQGYRGSNEAFEAVAIGLTWEQAGEGNRRAEAFTADSARSGQS